MRFEKIIDKLKESLFSVLPVCLLTILLNVTPIINFSHREITLFLISSLCLVVGMALFNLGADIAMTPMGQFVGSGLARSKKISVMFSAAFLMGMLITIAEPDLSVLASQLASAIDKSLLIYSVGFGVGLFLLISVAKIVFNKDLASLILFFYFTLFALVSISAINGKAVLFALAFDSGGVTTGPITVPFIMAFGVGVASSFGGKKVSENSFGLIALCSIGPVIAVMALSLFSEKPIDFAAADYSVSELSVRSVVASVSEIAFNVIKAVGLVFGIFFILNMLMLKIPKAELGRILIGLIITIIGLVIFLSAVEIGLMPTGFKMGTDIARFSEKAVVITGFVLGAVVVLAEPAVHVLNNQVEEITKGLISKKAMLIALCSGVGISIGLSMLRIVFDFSILYYLIPGYIISLGLSFFVPKIYTGIAFDSGGVASGPLTSCFILPFAVGVCMVLQGEDRVLYDAFGIVSMVAMTPLISIQCLGFGSLVKKLIRQKMAIRKIYSSADRQIIRF